VKNKAIFLDRDGVLNRSFVRDGKPYPPYTMEDFEILPGVVEAMGVFKSLGFLTVVVTNQPDIRTGKQTIEKIEQFHDELRRKLPIDDIRICSHTDTDDCHCRKPKPGLLLDAAVDLNIDCNHSVMVGDRWRDVMAGAAAGCRNFFVDYGYGEMVNLDGYQFQKVADLLEVANILSDIDLG
jgi:D-glycero-D-manno-heptose 1,7-bisphosphate phosphatase